MTLKSKLLVFSLSGSLLLSGCSTINPFGSAEDPPLPGERVSVLELQKELEPENTALNAQGFVAPQPWQNEFWPQRGGYPNHAMQHPAFTQNAFNKVWSSSIGQGTNRKTPLTAQPIVVGPNIYTLDANSEVRAFNTENGEQIWAQSIKPPSEEETAIGGGLSFGEEKVFVTNGFSEITALNPHTGELAWRKSLPAPSRSAPTILNKKLYIQTGDNQLLALDTSSGQEIWRYRGFEGGSGLIGASSPAVNKNMVIAAFSSGELTGLDPDNGSVLWSDTLAPRRRTGGISSVSDVVSLPVIDKDMIFAIGFGKRMLAISMENGRRLWQRDIGSVETPWVAGNHVFVLTLENKLVALGRESGSVTWVTDLKEIEKDENAYWTGPLLAGGRLITVSSKGRIAEINPEDGSVLRTSKAEGGVSIPPVIANGTLYLVSNNGKLTAYR